MSTRSNLLAVPRDLIHVSQYTPLAVVASLTESDRLNKISTNEAPPPRSRLLTQEFRLTDGSRPAELPPGEFRQIL